MRIRAKIIALAAAMLCLPLILCTQSALKPHQVPPPDARIDINHASVDELMKVPGMTRSWAGRIVRFRPYRAKSDLLDQGVVTSKIYQSIKDYVIAHREK